MFHAYFALGKDIEDPAVIAECAEDAAIDASAFTDEMTSGVAKNELCYGEKRAREYHVTATPSWLVNDDQLIVGLRSRAFFFALGHTLTSTNHRTDQASSERSDR